MKRPALMLIPVAVLVNAGAGCDGGAGGVRLSGEDLSPVTEVDIEITSVTHLDQLAGLYRDRERLSGDGGAAYAAGWRMSLDEASEHVDELIAFHVAALFYALAEEEDSVRTRAGLVGIIAEYAGVETDEVEGDVDRVAGDRVVDDTFFREMMER